MIIRLACETTSAVIIALSFTSAKNYIAAKKNVSRYVGALLTAVIACLLLTSCQQITTPLVVPHAVTVKQKNHKSQYYYGD
jgi:hypothetical protein